MVNGVSFLGTCIGKKEAEILSSTPSFDDKSSSRDFASTKISASDINIILDNIIESNMEKNMEKILQIK